MGNQIKELCSDKVEKWSWFSLLKPENKQSLRYGGPLRWPSFCLPVLVSPEFLKRQSRWNPTFLAIIVGCCLFGAQSVYSRS